MSLLRDIDEFFRRRDDAVKVDLHHIAHAAEDLPEDVRDAGARILSTPAGIGLSRRIFDVLENAVLDAYGHLETERALRFLAQYPVTDYTYDIAPGLSRGERPDAAKAAALARDGFGALFNLCAETPTGDKPVIDAAGLTSRLQAPHIGIVDMDAPTVPQVVEMLGTVARLNAAGVRVYMHCEAGKGRTGVMIACYRMAVMGWSLADAMTEAHNFGCSVPMQEAFIENFAKLLTANQVARDAGLPPTFPVLAGFPARPLGSVKATPRELAATLESAARGGMGVA